MIAGTLEIQMLANMARLADDMAKSKAIVGSTMKDIESSVESAKKALGALGIGLGVGYFVSLVKGSIDAMDHLNDLSKTTNITVETLAGLKVAAKQSGGDLESIAFSINKLSVEMGKHPEKFRAIGISAKDPLEAFKQLADVYVSIDDPQKRAAVGATALGKSWAGAAPLLAEGSKAIGEMVERGSKATGVTKEMAQQADALNDKWTLLTGTGGLLVRMIGPALPLLNSLADSMLAVGTNTEKTKASLSPFVEALKVIIVMAANVSFMFDTMGKDMARAIENVKLIVKGDWAGSRELGRMFREDAAAAKKALDEYEKKIMGMSLTGKPSAEGPPKPKPPPPGALGDFIGGDQFNIGKALQDGMDEEVKQLAEIAQITNDFRANERAQDQALIDDRNRMLMDAYDREQEEAIEHGKRLIQIEQWVAENKKTIQQNFMDFLGNLASLMNTRNRQVFEAGKIASIAQAAVKGALAVMDAWAAGMSTGGPWAPFIAAAYATAAALNAINLINNIRSQSYGGGGGAPVAPTQGGSGISQQGLGGGTQEASSTPAETQVTIVHQLEGLDDDTLLSGKQVRGIVEKINQSMRDGGRIVIA